MIEIRDRELASATTDLGGGGMSSSVGETAERYGTLKMRLAKEFARDRVRYTRAKSAFIQSVMHRIRLSH